MSHHSCVAYGLFDQFNGLSAKGSCLLGSLPKNYSQL